MFDFLKEKPEPAASDADLFLSLPEDKFFFFVSKLIRESNPNYQVMLVIAYQNLWALMKISAEIAKKAIAAKDPSVDVPVTIEDHIRYYDRIKTENRDNEFAVRRLSWFFQASLLKRAEILGLGRPQYDELLADIWITVAEGCYCLANVVQNNRLWSDDEKSWFSQVKSEKDGIDHCLNVVAPEEIRRIEKVQEFAASKGICLFTGDLDKQIAALEKMKEMLSKDQFSI